MRCAGLSPGGGYEAKGSSASVCDALPIGSRLPARYRSDTRRADRCGSSNLELTRSGQHQNQVSTRPGQLQPCAWGYGRVLWAVWAWPPERSLGNANGLGQAMTLPKHVELVVEDSPQMFFAFHEALPSFA